MKSEEKEKNPKDSLTRILSYTFRALEDEGQKDSEGEEVARVFTIEGEGSGNRKRIQGSGRIQTQDLLQPRLRKESMGRIDLIL